MQGRIKLSYLLDDETNSFCVTQLNHFGPWQQPREAETEGRCRGTPVHGTPLVDLQPV